MMQALTQLINFLVETGLPVREAAAEEAAMGNSQRKFHSKGGGSKTEDRETQKQKESSEGGLKKGTSAKRTENVLSDCEGEVNGYLHGDQRSESPETKISRSYGAGSQAAVGGSSTSLPPTAAKLKNEGNELFKSGQFGEAVLKYSEAIEYTTGLGECNTLNLELFSII